MAISGRSLGGVFAGSTAAVALLGMGARPASAIPIRGIEFPAGVVSFADVVFDYDPVGQGIPTPPHRNPLNALGTPDFNGNNHCRVNEPCTFVSLGVGGTIVLQFIDNSLTGSGTPDFDLHIFEIGPDIEDMFIWISKDGVNWSSVGEVFGSISSIDIDRFGFGPTDFFSFVLIQDDPSEGNTTGVQVGADIDSVGAISSGPPVTTSTTTTAFPSTTTTVPSTTTAPPSVPEPTSILLLGAGLLAWALAKASRRE